MHFRWLLLVSFIFVTIPASADNIRVAVASNFAAAAKVLAAEFEQTSDHQVTLIPGSTGKHYAQIKHGAPFDVFLAADVIRPTLLEQEGVAIEGSRFTYAIGKLVLWSPNSSLVDAGGAVLSSNRFRFLAMANPKLAPYGKAAQQTLKIMAVTLPGRIVRGENVGQTYQFVKSGNAELGFVAFSQLKAGTIGSNFEFKSKPSTTEGAVVKGKIVGSYWHIPQSMYLPIKQQAVLLKDKIAAREFLKYIHSAGGVEIIRRFGYDSPDAD